MVKRHWEFASEVHFTPVDPCFPGPLKYGAAYLLMRSALNSVQAVQVELFIRLHSNHA